MRASRLVPIVPLALIPAVLSFAQDDAPVAPATAAAFTETFRVDPSEWTTTGRNPWFVLEPGYQLVLESEKHVLTITVLDETRVVDGVETRVVEEREARKNGDLKEVSRNFFAINKRSNSVFYFGEEVDNYKDGKVVDHESAWLAGANEAKFGLEMPGEPLVGARYYQELAPGAAMDRAEIVGVDETFETPAGKFEHCVKIEETTPLEAGEHEFKTYAPGVGLLNDGSMKLVRYGKVGAAAK